MPTMYLGVVFEDPNGINKMSIVGVYDSFEKAATAVAMNIAERAMRPLKYTLEPGVAEIELNGCFLDDYNGKDMFKAYYDKGVIKW